MNFIKIYLFFIFELFNKNVKAEDDIFKQNKNIRFCGADLLPLNLSFAPKQNSKKPNNRLLKSSKFKQIDILVDTTHFEYQANYNAELKEKVPLLKSALNGAVEAIKDIINVEDRDDLNPFNGVKFQELFLKYSITYWSPIFNNNGASINSDFIIMVKFDFENLFPQGVIASAIPALLDPETNRPLLSILTITKDASFFSKRRALEYFRLVLLHELTHALGFLWGMFPFFPKGYNDTIKTEYIRYAYRTLIITPKVVEMAKKYFNCPNIKGIELEDQGGTGSAFSHWEQRVLLGDYMGAVIYQEEMAISEITLALLEDTGWYKINYYTGGLMRFGKNKGCDFLENNCLDGYFFTKFDNEFFDLNEALKPSCSTGRQSRTYSMLYEYNNRDNNYYYNFFYNATTNKYSSGTMYTTDYCFTHGERADESDNGYFTGNCKYGIGNYGSHIYYINKDKEIEEMNHPNSQFQEELGEVYSNNSFCIMSSLIPLNYSKIFSSIPHPMCYQVYCSSTSLTIKINDDYIICPLEGGNVQLEGYEGYIHCPDYNLICTGTVVCNDIFDCIEKKSLYKENTFIYDYKPVTTQRFSQIQSMPIVNDYDYNYEYSEDGVCPKYCIQCGENKKCKKCKEGYNLIGNKPDDDEPVICDNSIDINSIEYYLSYNNITYKCNEECDGCLYHYEFCINCKENYYPLGDINFCYKKDEKINGYYFNESLKIFDHCHKYCETCSKGPISDEEMNCDSCKEPYGLEGKNCVRINIFKIIWLSISIIIFVFIAVVLFVLFFYFRKKNTIEQKK